MAFKTKYISLTAVVALAFVFLFQNCGPGFKAQFDGLSFPSSSPEDPDPTAAGQYISPLDNPLVLSPGSEAGYEKPVSNRILFSGATVDGADADSFEKINDVYAKDKNRVYFRGKPLPDAKVSTFRLLKYGYSTDGVFCYFQEQRIFSANPQSFTPINVSYSKDAYRIFYKGSIVEAVDRATFTVVSAESAYDKNWVYWGMSILHNRKTTTTKHLGQNYWSVDGNIRVFGYQLENPDLESFQALSRYFAKDKNNIYHRSSKILAADAASFRILSDNYSVDSKNVYYLNETIPGADPLTFVPVAATYGKDARTVFRRTLPIASALPGSFEVIGDGYSRDENSVYFEHVRLAGITPKGMEILGQQYVRDQSNIYWTGQKLEVTNPLSMVAFRTGFAKDSEKVYLYGQPQPTLDAATFVDTGFLYLKDKNGIYIVTSTSLPVSKVTNASTGIDFSTFTFLNSRYAKNATTVFFINGTLNLAAIPGADSATFQALEDKPFGKDRNGVYSSQFLLTDADLNSFQLLQGPYAKDANRVFYNSNVVPNATPANFQILDDDFSRSGTTLYFRRTPVSGFDARKFQWIDCAENQRGFQTIYSEFSNGCYYTDGTAVYNGLKQIPGANPSNFSILFANEALARVGNQVFHNADLLVGADPETIEPFDRYYAKDKNSVYYKWVNIGADPATFREIRYGSYRDKNAVYLGGKPVAGLDINSFSLIGQSTDFIFKDNSKVFYGTKEVVGADAASMVVLDVYYSQDKNGFFKWGERTLTNPYISPQTGAITGVEKLSDGRFVVRGWACRKGSSYFTSVEIYAGGPLGRGKYISYDMNGLLPSPAAAVTACGSTGNFGFEVKIAAGAAKFFSGQPIYAQISDSYAWTLLTGGGKFFFP